jgi:hypothetical protein
VYTVRAVTDQAECESVWRSAVPVESVWDLWEFRDCFQRHFRRPLLFLTAESDRGAAGLLPLSWVQESGCYGCFPGEAWEGHTWLEQNRLLARDRSALTALLSNCPAAYHLRYLLPLESLPENERVVDEVGYLFLPPRYDYDLENYFQEFSRKSAKRVKKEIAAVENPGVEYRHDDFSDYDHLVRLNVDRFGERSYFADHRFTESFRDVARLLEERGWLRFTTVLRGGEIAAVDMGCVYRGTYTLLAGGTHAGFPGVAKLINLHHMRRGCEERFDQVDFLCGDFSWKKLFHLTPRPLYLLTNQPAAAHNGSQAEGAPCPE